MAATNENRNYRKDMAKKSMIQRELKRALSWWRAKLKSALRSRRSFATSTVQMMNVSKHRRS